MKKKTILILLLIAVLLGVVTYLLTARYHVSKGHTLSAKKNQKDVYYCPMHPNYTADKPGDCPICGMKLVKREEPATEPKILFYRNPMDPQSTSPVPMKDSMGMDYVPVYEEEKGAPQKGISISSERQQLIGVKKETVQIRDLRIVISSVGKVAYDPELYIAQQEYVETLKANNYLTNGNVIIGSAKRRLLLLGMSETQIEELTRTKRPQENLYLPLNSDSVWIYATIYEYELGLIKEGLPVEVTAVAYPGQEFTGNIVALTPVLDPMTRSARVRAEVKNPGQKLKPEMYVDVKISIDLGRKLSVSEEAVINTGQSILVVTANEKGNFFSQEVKLGQLAGGYYEVLSGLKEGDTVVTSGNFLIDSESRLQSAISPEHKHGE
jgi:Cu(I)/Ag(I) efflux system membrane fusion protein